MPDLKTYLALYRQVDDCFRVIESRRHLLLRSLDEYRESPEEHRTKAQSLAEEILERAEALSDAVLILTIPEQRETP